MNAAAIKLISITVLLLSSEMIMAADKQAITPSTSVGMPIENVVQMMLGLLAVLAVIFGCAWILRKYAGYSGIACGGLKALGGIPLGSREKIVLLQVGNKQVLVGVTPSSIQTIYVLEDNLVDEKNSFSKKNEKFSERLTSLLNKKK
jgi:flagellar protein FliO/FliZ